MPRTTRQTHKARVNGSCCPGCMFGMQYTEATEKCIRTGRWLKVLLRKRGRDEDLRKANRMDIDYPEDFETR